MSGHHLSELTRVLVGRRKLPRRLAPEQLVLALDRFGLTANNITYALAGDRMHYWQFFHVDQT